MANFSFIEQLNRFVRNPAYKFTSVDQISGVPLENGIEGFWSFIAAASQDIGETVYKGVKNFTKNLSNPDAANVAVLMSMADMVGYQPIFGPLTPPITPQLSKLIDQLSVTRYVYNETLSEEVVITVPDSVYASVWPSNQPTPYIGTVGVSTDLYFLESALTAGQLVALEDYETNNGALVRTTWYYEIVLPYVINLNNAQTLEVTVNDVSENANWPFPDTPPATDSFAYKSIKNGTKIYVSNLQQIPWKELLMFKFYEHIRAYFDFRYQMVTDENIHIAVKTYDDPVYQAYVKTDDHPSFFADWPEVTQFITDNGLVPTSADEIKIRTNDLNMGLVAWSDYPDLYQQACRLSIENDIQDLLATEPTDCSYLQWRNIKNVINYIQPIGWSVYEDQWLALNLGSELPDFTDAIPDLIEDESAEEPVSKERLIRGTAGVLANYAMSYAADRAYIKNQISSYVWNGTETWMKTVIADYITQQKTDESLFGITMPQVSGITREAGYVFPGAVNIIKYLDTVDYNNVAQLNELSAAGVPKKNNQTTDYTQKYFASLLGYPYSTTDTDATWSARTDVPSWIKTEVASLLATATLQGRYWEDGAAEWSQIPWKDIVDFYKELGVGVKDYTNYMAYDTTDQGLLIKTVTDPQTGIVRPMRLLSQTVIDMGTKPWAFPDVEPTDPQDAEDVAAAQAATDQNRADRGVFYYIMWVHQLGAAKGKADIDSINASDIWKYYANYTAAKQNTNWMMAMENVNHVSFKPISYLAGLSRKIIETFASETVQLPSFGSDGELASALETSYSNTTGNSTDSWRKENVDWTVYSTYQEISDSTAPDGTQNKYMAMDGPWSLKFLKGYVTGFAGMFADDAAVFRSYFAHVSLDTGTMTDLIAYFNDNGTLAVYEALEGIEIKWYGKTQDGMTFTQFADGSIFVRAKGWPICVPITSAIANDYILNTDLMPADFFADVSAIHQPYANYFVYEWTKSSVDYVSIVKIDDFGTIKRAVLAKGKSTFIVTAPKVSVSGQWLGIIDNISITGNDITADYYWYDIRTGQNNNEDADSIAFSLNPDADTTKPLVWEQFGTSMAIGRGTSSGGWTMSLFDFTQEVSSGVKLTWTNVAGFNPALVTTQITTKSSTGYYGQMLETNDSGTVRKWICPSNNSTSKAIIPFSTLTIKYGPRMRAYLSEDMKIAGLDGTIKGIYQTLENDMFDFTPTTWESFGSISTTTLADMQVSGSSMPINWDYLKIPTSTVLEAPASETQNEVWTKNFDYAAIYKTGLQLEPGDADGQYTNFLNFDVNENTLTTGVQSYAQFTNDIIFDFDVFSISGSEINAVFGPLKNLLDVDWNSNLSIVSNQINVNDFRSYSKIFAVTGGMCLQYNQYNTANTYIDNVGNQWMNYDRTTFNYYTVEFIPLTTKVVSTSSKMSNSNIFSVEIVNSGLSAEEQSFIESNLKTIINRHRSANTQLLNIIWKD